MKFRTEPLKVVGLDVETVATTGELKLLGLWYPAPHNQYVPKLNPRLFDFYQIVKSLAENSEFIGFVTWGRLDIQCLIRLFQPTERERKRIARGIAANVKNGEIIGSPPVMRKIGNVQFYIAHYIPGRSMKLGYIENGYERTFWIFNMSQFYQNTIATIAVGLGLQWTTFPKDTHIIDWQRYTQSKSYRLTVLASNEQDAHTVTTLAEMLQQRFHEVFDCYPSLLVSTGSLTDAAVSKMLSEHATDYQSNSWKWLATHVWKSNGDTVIARAETLLAEAFSAGYVDQFAVGYFDTVCTADIAAAYPHKIRSLPDLRNSVLLDGVNDLVNDLQRARLMGYTVWTVIIRGKVSIPETLKFHPITVKTYDRENYRPVGTFYASYLLEEREFCEAHGATFDNEQYVIVALRERTLAPIAGVSIKLGEFRSSILAEMRTCERNSDRWKTLDGQQYLVKVIDNSIYGKTVMTTEVVKDVDGEPIITGYIAGDRFNHLYGAWITSQTRLQIASACMEIERNGGQPVMVMTDSIYWKGSPDALSSDVIRATKTPGYFETPHTVTEFFILKTGQYEYRDGNSWHYKLRGLNVDRDELDGVHSLYHRLITGEAKHVAEHTHPKDFIIEIPTRKLISIGSPNLAQLGMISEGITELRPFVLSGKQSERYILHWRDCLTGHQWLETPLVTLKANSGTAQYPLQFLSTIYEQHTESWSNERMTDIRKMRVTKNRRMDDLKRYYIWLAAQRTNLPIPDGRSFRLSWDRLEEYFGLPRTDIPEFAKASAE